MQEFVVEFKTSLMRPNRTSSFLVKADTNNAAWKLGVEKLENSVFKDDPGYSWEIVKIYPIT